MADTRFGSSPLAAAWRPWLKLQEWQDELIRRMVIACGLPADLACELSPVVPNLVVNARPPRKIDQPIVSQ